MFEYSYLVLRDLDPNGRTFAPFLHKLQELGANGYELAGFEYGCAWFKKPVPIGDAAGSVVEIIT
jgi:hypothetical protein